MLFERTVYFYKILSRNFLENGDQGDLVLWSSSVAMLRVINAFNADDLSIHYNSTLPMALKKRKGSWKTVLMRKNKNDYRRRMWFFCQLKWIDVNIQALYRLKHKQRPKADSSCRFATRFSKGSDIQSTAIGYSNGITSN